MRKDKILKITMGLPGCGKSTWVKSEKKEHGYGFFRDFDFDRVTTGKIEIENFAKELNEYILYGSIILVDGLFLTYSDIEKLLSF